MATYVFHADINKFDAQTTRYYGENALVLADCAKLAYSSGEEIQEAIQTTWQFKNFKFFDSGKSTQAFIAGNDAIIIVAFRGTEPSKILDLAADANMKLVNDPDWQVHEGFNNALHEVWGEKAIKEDMRQTLKAFHDNNQTIWFTGHSLGAALATLAAAEYVLKDGGTINGLYTIGQPRVGNDKFAARFDAVLKEKTFRFVNNNDIVPRVPLYTPILKYTHPGVDLYIDSNGVVHDTISFWSKLWDKLKGAKDDLGNPGPDALNDHKSDHYVQFISQNRTKTTKWS